jgi:hypothetical protein
VLKQVVSDRVVNVGKHPTESVRTFLFDHPGVAAIGELLATHVGLFDDMMT